MAYTEVKTTGYGGRLKESCSGIMVGIIMFIAGTALIWWNEDRTKKTADMLDEAQEVCVDVDNVSKIDPSINGQLIHATANAITPDTIADPQFAEVRSNAIRISREAQYYQYVEESHTETKEKLGGTKEEVTTYTYKKQWTSSPVNSGDFHDPDYQGKNFVKMQFDDSDVYASTVNFGAYTFTEQMIRSIGGAKPMNIAISDATLADLSKQADPSRSSTRNSNEYYNTSSSNAFNNYQGEGGSAANVEDNSSHPYAKMSGQGTLYIGRGEASPEIGDVKVTFTYVPSDVPVSILAKVNGSSFSSWQAKNKKQLLVVTAGSLTSEEMFQSERDTNDLIKWLCRIGGLLLIIMGLRSMFSILGAIFNFVPFLAHIVNAGVGLVCGVLGFAWALLVFAIAWMAARPVLGISTLVVVVGLVVFLIVRGRKKRAEAALNPAAVPAAVDPSAPAAIPIPGVPAETPAQAQPTAPQKESIFDKANKLKQKIEAATGAQIPIPGLPQNPQQAQQPQMPQQAQQPQMPTPQAPASPTAPATSSGNAFCPKCGTKLPPGSAFCPKCGAPQ